ncbi:unnamed protein product [Arabis nemorensis]|uniref:Jacalin-type lectin domain-containing protein n=1 Tax=Arabis nemorensis TaxID=586526 RepID=A0A565CVM7_9BRAS|nr:unnamed protein product [Arabis nemorensis]
MVNTKGISYLKIQYVKDDKFEIRDHGSYTQDQKEVDFEVEYLEEYITAVTISWTLTSTEPQVMVIVLLTSYSRSEVLGIPWIAIASSTC